MPGPYPNIARGNSATIPIQETYNGPGPATFTWQVFNSMSSIVGSNAAPNGWFVQRIGDTLQISVPTGAALEQHFAETATPGAGSTYVSSISYFNVVAAPPPVPTLSASGLLIANVPTIRLVTS